MTPACSLQVTFKIKFYSVLYNWFKRSLILHFSAAEGAPVAQGLNAGLLIDLADRLRSRSRRYFLNRKRNSIARSLSISTFLRPDMTNIQLKHRRRKRGGQGGQGGQGGGGAGGAAPPQ